MESRPIHQNSGWWVFSSGFISQGSMVSCLLFYFIIWVLLVIFQYFFFSIHFLFEEFSLILKIYDQKFSFSWNCPWKQNFLCDFKTFSTHSYQEAVCSTVIILTNLHVNEFLDFLKDRSYILILKSEQRLEPLYFRT